MSELLTRAMTGAAYVAVTLLAAWAGAFTTALLYFPVCLVAADEFHRLYHAEGEGPPRFWNVLLAGMLYVTLAIVPRFEPLPAHLIVALCLALLVLSLAWMMFTGVRDLPRSFAGLLLTVLYIALPFALLPGLFSFGNAGTGHEVLVGFFLLLWTNDTGAYLVGRTMGRTKMLPSVSPKKTIEGLVGGIALTLVVAYVLWRVWPTLPLRHWMAAAAIVSIAGTVGDLFESALKRARGVKDSGTVLPGHGGIMDRFDGLLLAAPCLYAYLLMTR